MKRILLPALALAACSEAAPPLATTTHDSAGVAIVQTSAAAAPQYDAIRVLDIGTVDGAPEYQLHRVSHLARLADGTVVVANGGTELRFFTADGEYLRRSGGEGGGPGEFRNISYLRALDGDSLLAYDVMNRRISIIAPDGAHARDFTPPSDSAGNPMQVMAALADGTLLVRARANPPREMQEQVRRDTLQFAVAMPTMAHPIPRTYGGMESKITIGMQGSTISSVSIAQLPVSRNNYTGATADAFVIASSDTYELHTWDDMGALVRIVRRDDVPPQPVDDALFERVIDARVAEIVRRGPERAGAPAPDGDAIRASYRALPRVPTAPAFEGMVVADDGAVWTRRFSADAADTHLWDVHDGTGAVTHVVALPAAFRPLLLVTDTVYGVQRDELDVEHVVAYRVQR